MNIEIITEGLPNDDQVLLLESTMTYAQNPDCTEDRDSDWQKLTISTRNNGVDKFLNIKTDNWSLDNAESLCDIIKDYCKRVGFNE